MPAWKRNLWIFGALLASAALAYGFPFSPRSSYAIDFHVFYDAGRRALAHQTVYESGIHLQFKYAPFVAHLFGWLWGGFDFEQALRFYAVTFAVGWFAFFGWIAHRAAQRFIRGYQGFSDPRLPAATLSLVVVQASPLAEELGLGQINLIPIGLLWVFFDQYKRDATWVRLVVVSLALSIAIQFKLFALLAFPFLVFRREWKWVAICLLEILLCSWCVPALVSSPAFASSEFSSWLTHLFSSTQDLMSSRYNASLLGALLKAGLPSVLATGLWALGVLTFFGFQFRWKDRDVLESAAWTLLAIVVLNPLVWSYWSVFALPALLWTLGTVVLAKQPRRYLTFTIAFAFVWVLVTQAHHSYFNRDGAFAVVMIVLAALFVWSRKFSALLITESAA